MSVFQVVIFAAVGLIQFMQKVKEHDGYLHIVKMIFNSVQIYHQFVQLS